MYPQVFGKYVLERELARGGMARVMLATLRGAGGFEKKLVVKQIRDELAYDEEFVRRFVEEAKTTVALSHPNIVPVYELGVELGTYYLAMELVAGASVSELLRASHPGGLSPEEGAYVGVEVCRALDYAHRRMGVVHRDVTPRNVMVDEEGQVKVIDFGIAAPVATAPSGHGVFGTPGHMPPEQMAGIELTPAADVFAVAALLMEAWSGKAPFRRGTLDETDAALLSPHPRPSAIDIRLLPLDDVIARALSLDPTSRPAQADDLGRVLRRFLAGIDLGDLARQLGDRVRVVRAQPPGLTRSPSAVLQRPASRPTGVQVATRTFAARRDLPDAEPSTRRLPSIPTAPLDVADFSEPHPISGEITPARGERARRAWLSFSVWGAFGIAIALAVAAFGTHPTHAPGRAGALPAAPPTVGGVGGASDPALVRATHRDPSPPPDPGSPDPAPASAQPARSSPALSSSASAPGLMPRAQLTLFGEGTQVRVDGVPYGACPAHVAVEPGAHAVVFVYPATGESKEERLKLRAGEHATLRADFTAAMPTVRVAR